ncbi:TetR/AcrR family transcriptional regulator [Tuberibacillus sp. Marseille-P3662]|uniref:TetR/AcrR family transcriptional regulator n=1 Tax=Tuberibacillus sp. Marseille-P3662 TaxID=1965358 RepID=UPI000A1C85AC|nr:TetR/AcrR family transcriptional regulator [Tuberibacillus sp. Marseille-P3662]
MSGFERLKRQKQQAIRNAAFSLFSQMGIKDAKISDIAKQAGVSQVTIYNHFESKEGLLRDVIKHYMEHQLNKYRHILDDQTVDFMEKVRKIMFDKSQNYRFFNREMLEQVLVKDEALRVYIEDFYQKRSLPFMMDLIEEGKQEGKVRADLSVEAVQFYINMFQEHMERHSDLLTEHNQTFADDLMHMFFYGLISNHTSCE